MQNFISPPTCQSPQAELGRRVNLSTAAVNRRLKRLADEGVIRRYTVEIEPSTVGYPLTIIAGVEAESERVDLLDEMKRVFGSCPEVHYTVISATDGNHGRSLAAAARDAGCRCVIMLHANVSNEREQAIAAFGAQIVRISGNYDESVDEAARLAASNGWQVISDTSYAGYEDIPRDVMQGYATIAAEIVEQTGSQPGKAGAFTHVLLQGGVGGLAAGITSFLWEYHGAHRPCFIVVEPAQADCLLQSALNGHASRATGSVDSVMAGLACGEASTLAWKFLQAGVDHFMTIDDGQAIEAMRVLAQGGDKDIPIIAGESGTAELAALQALRDEASLAKQTGIDAQSRVLIINTEGATAPEVYEALVDESAKSVRARQSAWKASPNQP